MCFCLIFAHNTLAKVSARCHLAQHLLPIALTTYRGSSHRHGCRCCGSPRNGGWPGPYECLVVDPLNVHVVIWSLRAGPGPPRAGPGPPQAGPGLLARIAQSAHCESQTPPVVAVHPRLWCGAGTLAPLRSGEGTRTLGRLLLCGPSPLRRAGPGPPQAGPGLLARIARSAH